MRASRNEMRLTTSRTQISQQGIMLNRINLIDFPKICRLCLEYGGSKNIFEMPYFLLIISNISKVKVLESDILPTNICDKCNQKLEDISQFAEMCNGNNDILIAIQAKITEADSLTKIEQINNASCATLRVNDENDDDSVKSEDHLEHTYADGVFHKNNELSSIPFKCFICDWSGESVKALKRHENKHLEVSANTNIKKWKCADCSKLFVKKIDLQRHQRIHTGLKPFACSLCSRSFTQKSTLDRHIISLHSKTEAERQCFECYICERKFLRKDHLEAHMINVHIKKQTNTSLDLDYLDWMSCKTCGKSFSIYSYLQCHLTVHEDKLKKIKRHKSKTKSFRFTTTSNLCCICGKTFEKRKTYQTHMRRNHSNQNYQSKPRAEGNNVQKDHFQCWHCGKIFSTHSNLKVHIRIHTGEKPYECKFCGQKFSAYSTWHGHENIHTGAKPFQCEHCKKGFRQRGSLRKHLRSSVHKICQISN